MDAVVTARVPQEKKDSATRILRDLGMTPSQAINRLFDYVIANKEVPFESKRRHSPEEIADMLAFIDSLSSPTPSTMTDDEIREARLSEKYSISFR